MNPNGYGHNMPVPSHQGRPNMPYGRHPPPMSPHQAYPHYYPQHMGTMMPQYQQYPPQWYPQYPPQYPPQYGPRQPYYQQPMPQTPQQIYQPQGPLVVSSPPHMPPQRPYPPLHQSSSGPPQPASLVSTASSSNLQTQTPPSRPVSEAGAQQEKKSLASPAPVTSPIAQEQTTPTSKSAAPVEPFDPPVPWLSVPDEEFPPRAQRTKRKILRSRLHHEPLYFPPESAQAEESQEQRGTDTPTEVVADGKKDIEPPTPTETPTTIPSDTQSDRMSTQPTTPSSVVATTTKSQQTPTQPKSRVAIPIVPIIPVVPTSPVAARRAHRDSTASARSKTGTDAVSTADETQIPLASAETPAPDPPAPPKSWAELVRKQTAANAASAGVVASAPIVNGLVAPKSDSLGEVLGEINVAERPTKVAFLQPRGLVNTGNMCYMNSVLQVLVFCIPFYDLLDRVAQRAAHTFKSSTPLIDAMIMFMKEYSSIDAASSVEQLRLRLNPGDFEKYGDNLRPDFVYDTINKLPRFRDMRRGHQQDAQEFLGFLLEELHEECAYAMQKSSTNANSGRSTPVGSVSNASEGMDTQDGWMEVGHKQKPAVTRSSGGITSDSPVTNIFGGKLRSELKIPGNQLSVTLEPYQPLQLDIGSPQVSNIVDALKGLTKPESMQGDFQSVRGNKATATKQVFIETLPPVLILHLKRFQYDATTKRAEKIWKKVGYPLELEIPKEVFQPAARTRFAAHGGLPRYRLTGVIYHHGKNANGGHYTVDIRRQDGQEWIRLDDTLIRRIRSEDVAEGGSEEDPKVLAAALEKHKKQALSSSNNRYENIEADDDEELESGNAWSQVANGHGRSRSTASALINGSATPAKDASGPQTPRYRDSVKDNKVAYLLFYQRTTS